MYSASEYVYQADAPDARAIPDSDTLAEWLRRQPAKLVGSARAGSNPAGVVMSGEEWLGALLVQWLEYAVANGVARVRFPDSAFLDFLIQTYLVVLSWLNR